VVVISVSEPAVSLDDDIVGDSGYTEETKLIGSSYAIVASLGYAGASISNRML